MNNGPETDAYRKLIADIVSKIKCGKTLRRIYQYVSLLYSKEDQ